jgi:hypothetical protein
MESEELLGSFSPHARRVLQKHRAALLLDKLQGRAILDAGVGHPRVISATCVVLLLLGRQRDSGLPK